MNAIDYITLLLVNTAAGLIAGALFLWRGLGGTEQNSRPWAAVFAAAGLVSLVMGVHMSATWPVKDAPIPATPAVAATADHAAVPEQPAKTADLRFANIAFGETCVLFGALMLGLALALAKGWSLLPISIYSAVLGATAVAEAFAIWDIGITAKPWMAAGGFALAGAGALLVPLAVWRPGVKPIRWLAGAALAASGLVWLATGLPAYYMHLRMFSR